MIVATGIQMGAHSIGMFISARWVFRATSHLSSSFLILLQTTCRIWSRFFNQRCSRVGCGTCTSRTSCIYDFYPPLSVVHRCHCVRKYLQAIFPIWQFLLQCCLDYIRELRAQVNLGMANSVRLSGIALHSSSLLCFIAPRIPSLVDY